MPRKASVLLYVLDVKRELCCDQQLCNLKLRTSVTESACRPSPVRAHLTFTTEYTRKCAGVHFDCLPVGERSSKNPETHHLGRLGTLMAFS